MDRPILGLLAASLNGMIHPTAATGTAHGPRRRGALPRLLSSAGGGINAAMEEQSATTGEIARNVTEAARGAAQSRSASEQLASVAEELEALVGGFRV